MMMNKISVITVTTFLLAISMQAKAKLNSDIQFYCEFNPAHSYRQSMKMGDVREVTLNVGGVVQVEHEKTTEDFSHYLLQRLIAGGIGKKCAKILMESSYARLDEQPDGSLVARLYFDFDKAELKPHAKTVLSMIFDRLQKVDSSITVAGHADSIGSRQYNLKLGVLRSDAVIQQLLAMGATKSDFERVSFGESKPIATNKTAQGRELNRRVDVRL